MTNKSERAVSTMSDEEFDERFPDEKAAIDWFIDMRYRAIWFVPIVEQVSVFTGKEKDLKFSIVPTVTIPSRQSKALFLKNPILIYANGLEQLKNS
jgi:hypothetical protein